MDDWIGAVGDFDTFGTQIVTHDAEVENSMRYCVASLSG